MREKNQIRMWKFIPPRERAKLWVMLTALVLLVGAMFGLMGLVGRKEGTSPGSDAGKRTGETFPEDDTVQEQANGDGPIVMEPGEGDDGFDLYDPEILKEAVDNTNDVTMEALLLLIHKLQGKTHEALMAEQRAEIFVNDLLEKPSEHRGKLVYVDGAVEKIYKRHLGTNSTGVELVYFGRLNHVGDVTRPVGFYLLDGPLGTKPGESVELRGYFLSLWRPKGKDEVLPIIVGRRFDPPAWLTDPASLDTVREGGFLRERKAVYYCLSKIMGMSQAQIRAAVDEEITPAQMMTTPEEVRGRFVGFTGAVIKLGKEFDPNPTGQSEYFAGYLLNKDDQACMFYILDNPGQLEDRALVRIDGIFMKNYRYVSKKSVETTASVIIGRTLTPVKLDWSSFNALILGVCGAALVIVAYAGMREARAARRRMQESRKRTLKRAPRDLEARVKEAARRARQEPGK